MDYLNPALRQFSIYSAAKLPWQSDMIDSIVDRSVMTSSQDSPLASPPPEGEQTQASGTQESASVPSWRRELARSYATRPSRASSMVTTRTRMSAMTVQEDARSIELNLGGQYFHINRDGSRITSLTAQDALPAYSANPTHSSADAAPTETPQPDSGLATGTNFLRVARANVQSVGPPSRQDMALPPLPSEQERLPEGSLTTDDSTPTRHPSYKTGKEVISISKLSSQRRTVSQSDVPAARDSSSREVTGSPPLRRRNDIRLPSLVTSLLGDDATLSPKTNSGSPRSRHSTSAGPVLASEQPGLDVPQSPAYYGKHATGRFPAASDPIAEDAEKDAGLTPVITPPGAYSPLPMESENDVSSHYTRVIKFLDRDYRRKLHERDKENEETRTRLHDQDTVYRQQLRAQDFQIDDLKKRLAHQEETFDSKLEKARNEVEDTWEQRWKDRDRHLMERMRRMELDTQKSIEAAVKLTEQNWRTRCTELQTRVSLSEAGEPSQEDDENQGYHPSSAISHE